MGPHWAHTTHTGTVHEPVAVRLVSTRTKNCQWTPISTHKGAAKARDFPHHLLLAPRKRQQHLH